MESEKTNIGSQSVALQVVHLTSLAVEQAKLALERRGIKDGVLRIGVSGGGCSGMQYSLSIDREAKPNDVVFEQEGLRIAVEEQAVPYLRGTVIDYVSGLHGAGFKFMNPNAVRTCGCGSSFATGSMGSEQP